MNTYDRLKADRAEAMGRARNHRFMQRRCEHFSALMLTAQRHSQLVQAYVTVARQINRQLVKYLAHGQHELNLA